MPKLAHLRGPLAVLPLLAALVSIAPLVRWCPMPWGAVAVADFVACEAGERVCQRPCAGPRRSMACAEAAESMPCGAASDAMPCERECGAQPASGGRAFCLEDPSAATPGRGAPLLDPPPAVPAELASNLPPEPAVTAAWPRLLEDARPHAPPRSLPPPVRGPPSVT